MKKLMMIMVAASAANALAIQGTISTDTEQISGDIKWQPRAKIYVIEKGKISREVKLADVAGMDIQKPAPLDKALSQVESGQAGAAIPALQKIVADYRMLQWDKPAARALVEAYLATNKGKEAYDTAQKLIDEEKSAAYTGDLAPAYWRALLATGKNERLEACLDKAAKSGDRGACAEALVMRGNVVLARGNDSQESLRQALIDNFLRVALLYTTPECRKARKSAMTKAAECLDKLGMSSRAETLRAQAKDL